MPIFEYLCKDCGRQFETIIFGNSHPECPSCRSRALEKLLSRFAVGGRKEADHCMPESMSQCAGCNGARMPGGGCPMN